MSEPTTTNPADRVDLDSPQQVAEMVRRFYRAVAQDDVLGPMFNDVAKVDWSAHIPRLTEFWSRVLLGQHGYDGNPLQKHLEVHRRQPFTPAHFHRWLELFNETLNDGWSGPVTERAKHLANNVARVHSTQILGQAVTADEGSTGMPVGPVRT